MDGPIPKLGDIWTIGNYTGLQYLGVGTHFDEANYYVFQNGARFFVILCSEFFDVVIPKTKTYPTS